MLNFEHNLQGLPSSLLPFPFPSPPRVPTKPSTLKPPEVPQAFSHFWTLLLAVPSDYLVQPSPSSPFTSLTSSNLSLKSCPLGSSL